MLWIASIGLNMRGMCVPEISPLPGIALNRSSGAPRCHTMHSCHIWQVWQVCHAHHTTCVSSIPNSRLWDILQYGEVY